MAARDLSQKDWTAVGKTSLLPAMAIAPIGYQAAGEGVRGYLLDVAGKRPLHGLGDHEWQQAYCAGEYALRVTVGAEFVKLFESQEHALDDLGTNPDPDTRGYAKGILASLATAAKDLPMELPIAEWSADQMAVFIALAADRITAVRAFHNGVTPW